MSAGMMPALDLPGLIRPGQFGPMMRVAPEFCAYWKNHALSWTGTPSVMTTARPICASTASTTAALVKAGGTKRTETFAPVSAMPSATEPKTGSDEPSKSTLVPALRGLTPPTTWAPDASMRCVCFMPSDPVMPWTRILLFSLRKIAMSLSRPLLRGRELSGAAGRTVHGVDALDQRVVGLGEDATTLVRVVAVETDDERLVDRVTVLRDQLERLDDAVGDLVARGDATEDVHEDALDGRVAEDDLEAVGHDLRRGAATDVEEVRGLDAAELLTGVRDDVERAHDQAGAVADDADLAVELDVVEALLLRGGLKGVRVGLVLERLVVLVTELCVLVERD